MKRRVTREELDSPLLPYGEAVARVLAAFHALPAIEVPLLGAHGLVAAAPVVAARDVPGFDSSAMDGYAIVAADTARASATAPAVLRLTGDLPAGTVAAAPVVPGTATTIMTGAPVPSGADAVVPWEDTEPREGEVAVLVPVEAGANVRTHGEDVRAGEEVLAAGTVLGAPHLGILAALGHAKVRAHPRPRIAVLSTGDEVVAPGETLRPGQIYDANATLIGAFCESAGADVARLGLVRDDPVAISAWMEEAAAATDLVVTSGGVSVGEHDWLREVLEKEGALDMWRVAMKPGKPVAFGRMRGKPVVALPGNPGSAFVAAHAFLVPAIRVMAGRDPEHASVQASLARDVRGSVDRLVFLRVSLEAGVATPLASQSSVVISNLMHCDGLALVPPGGLPAGAEVRVELLR